MNKSLRSLTFPSDVDTSKDDIDQVLMNPCLAHSVSYDRGVGYFTSGWLQRVATGIAGFAQNGGTMRLLTSPKLKPEDWAAIKQGADAIENEVLLQALRAEVDELAQSASSKPVQALSYMIAEKLLTVRLAVPTGKLSGDYHPKLGIFRDHTGDSVVFHGSQNETEQGRRNFESLDVFLSWVDPRDASRVESHRKRFERLWTNSDPNVRCFDIPEAIRANLAQFYRPSRSSERRDKADSRWRHQDDAIECFLSKKNGVLEMATGTGKTRTALRIIQKLTSLNLVDTVIVTMRGNDLLEQWFQAMVTDSAYRIYRHFGQNREGPRFVASRGKRLLLVSQSYLSDFISSADGALERTLIICDEVHGFGSPAQVSSLTGWVSPIGYRLGLSATPEREYDEIGNGFIETEIGPVIFKFEIEDAIRRGILCEFDYTALEYELSDEDRVEIRNLIKRHHGKKAAGEVVSDEALYRELSRVRKVTTEKLEPFKDHLAANPELYERSLIFVETRKYGELVQRHLLEAGIVFGTYYEGDEPQRLLDFAQGKLDCLVSCHRLSEGIDIKSVRNIVLFSSARAKLETIQRLGRCLRTDPSNVDKRAHVLDFIDFGDEDDSDTADLRRYEWLAELSGTRREEL